MSKDNDNNENIERFVTHILLHGFKGFRNMEYWEIEFFLHRHKWASVKKKWGELNKNDITIKEIDNED